MNDNDICPICERGVNLPSPRTEENLRHLADAGRIDTDGTPSPDLAVRLESANKGWTRDQDVAAGLDSYRERSDGRVVHESCQSVLDFLESIETSPSERSKKRLAGYKAGLPFGSYMNGHWMKTASANSYRVLATAWHAMDAVESQWRSGNVLPGECFQYVIDRSTNQLALLVQDVDLQESSMASGYAFMAQMALSYAVVLWCAAHKPIQKYDDDQEMFLEYCKYGQQWKRDIDHFKDRKRNKAISHVTKGSLDDLNLHLSYTPYPDWHGDWQRFRKLLGHSIYLCRKDIAEKQGEPKPDIHDATSVYPEIRKDGESDPIKRGVNLFNALGMPTKKGTGSRPRLQGPYLFPVDVASGNADLNAELDASQFRNDEGLG